MLDIDDYREVPSAPEAPTKCVEKTAEELGRKASNTRAYGAASLFAAALLGLGALTYYAVPKSDKVAAPEDIRGVVKAASPREAACLARSFEAIVGQSGEPLTNMMIDDARDVCRQVAKWESTPPVAGSREDFAMQCLRESSSGQGRSGAVITVTYATLAEKTLARCMEKGATDIIVAQQRKAYTPQTQ